MSTNKPLASNFYALKPFFSSSLFCDIDIEVQAKTIPAHQAVLATFPSLATILNGDIKEEKTQETEKKDTKSDEQKDEIELFLAKVNSSSSGPSLKLCIRGGGVNEQVVRSFLEYLYTREMRPIVEGMTKKKQYHELVVLNRLATQVGVDCVGDTASSLLASSINESNAFELLGLTNSAGMPVSLHFLESRIKTMLKSAGFLAASPCQLISLIDMGEFKVKEVEVFKALINWSENECQRKNLKINPENERKVLDDILPYVRFPTMSIEEISSTVVPSKILTSEESIEIFSYVSTKKDSKKKPECRFPTQPRTPESVGDEKEHKASSSTSFPCTVTPHLDPLNSMQMLSEMPMTEMPISEMSSYHAPLSEMMSPSIRQPREFRRASR
eukprot:TRINITY_DN572_c0_g1_i1.p1 TRINITY_DN572_c0_g1~~TRINITY_DN572_c0_g1_i1.p1  ORF type:complete len:386 (+),score=77.56 TRINITY_DN572_c0_g1_i1:26-1183(+)